MNDKYTLFIPMKSIVNNPKISNGTKFSHFYRKKQFHLLNSENIKWWNKPYFAILNENGIVKSFIDAIILDKLDDAKVYVSKSIVSNLDLNEIGRLFEKKCFYKYSLNYYFDDKLQHGVNRVTIAAKSKDEQIFNDIIHVQMIDEPDMFGKWKIYKIEKE